MGGHTRPLRSVRAARALPRKAKSPAEADLLFGLAFETVRVRMPPDRQDSWFALMEEHGMVLNRPSEKKMQEMIDRVESEL